jgi:hypothetical protein
MTIVKAKYAYITWDLFCQKVVHSPVLIPFPGDTSMEITWTIGPTRKAGTHPTPPNEFLDTWLNS